MVKCLISLPITVPDPDLEIRGGGGGGMQTAKKIFSALLASVWAKIRGAGPPDPFPGSAND